MPKGNSAKQTCGTINTDIEDIASGLQLLIKAVLGDYGEMSWLVCLGGLQTYLELLVNCRFIWFTWLHLFYRDQTHSTMQDRRFSFFWQVLLSS